MSEPLRSQISYWWQTVSSEETLNTYQNALQITWNILRETAKMLWLFLCLGLVFFDWFRDTAITSGRRLKAWVDSLQEPKAEHAWAGIVQWLKSVGQLGTSKLLNQAREQVGIAPTRPIVQPSMASASVSAAPVSARSEVQPANLPKAAPAPEADLEEA
jgi:hypothetical protein